jgi:hypothetical protein
MGCGNKIEVDRLAGLHTDNGSFKPKSQPITPEATCGGANRSLFARIRPDGLLSANIG